MLRVATADTRSTAAHPDAIQRHTSALQASAIETDQTAAHRDSVRIAAVTAVTQPTAPAATDPIAALLNVGTTFIATTSKVVTAVLASFATPAPGAPADSPLMWAVLAIVRRQFFNETPSITPTVSAPDALGNITISLSETDSDGDRLVYSANNGSKGAVSLNADGHSFTYDPTAGASGTDSITITATDATNAHIHGLPGLLNAFTFGLLGTSGHTASTTVTVTATNAPTLTTASIGAPDQTTGAVTVTLVAADADDDPLTLTVTQPALGTVSAPVLIDAATGTYTVTYTPTGQARLDAYESAGDDFDSFKVDVSDGHYPAVEVTVSHVPISPAEAAVTGTIPVGSTPVAVAFSRDGTRAYVAALFGDTVSVIDTATNTVVGTISTGAPSAVAVSKDGTRLYIVNLRSNSVSVIDTATNLVTGAPIAVGGRPLAASISPDGSHLYVVNSDDYTVSVIDTATNTVTATIPVGVVPTAVATSPDGTRVYVTNLFGRSVSVIDTTTNTVTATIAVGAEPRGVAVSPDGTHAYVTGSASNTVSVIDTATNTVTAIVPVGGGPFDLAVSPDGTRVYVTTFLGTVSIIDTATNAVVMTVPLGTTPQNLAVSPDGTRAYITQPYVGTVSVISFADRDTV